MRIALFAAACCLVVSLQLASCATPIRRAGYCATYGVCDSQDPNRFPVNCDNNIPAQSVTFPMKHCPEFSSSSCCSQPQYQLLENNLPNAQTLFGRCPACMNNFRLFWCAYACSPDQSLFMEVLDTQIGSQGTPVVNHTLMTFGADFAWSLFNSCRNVQFGDTNQTVFSLFFNNPVSPVALLDVMGKQSPALGNPYQLDMNVAEEPAKYAFDGPTIPCNASCSCTDCPSVCENLQPMML